MDKETLVTVREIHVTCSLHLCGECPTIGYAQERHHQAHFHSIRTCRRIALRVNYVNTADSPVYSVKSRMQESLSDYCARLS